MNKDLLIRLPLAALLLATAVLGCKKSTPNAAPEDAPQAAAAPASAPVTPPPAAASSSATSATEWTPTVKGLPYQLSLKDGVFGFCDDSGSQGIDLATGKQTAGSATCDRKHEVVQSSCDDRVKIYGATDGGSDDLSFGDNDYTLPGHSRECDLDGHFLIVSTVGAVELIDTAANKVASVDPAGGDKVAIGSGWVAWSSLDSKRPLRLETIAKAMEHASTPKK